MKKNYKVAPPLTGVAKKMKTIVLGSALLCCIGSSVQAQTGAALNFDGTNDNAVGAVLTTATSSVTMEAKIYWGGTNGSNQVIMFNGNVGGNGYGLFLPAGSNVVNYLYGGVAFSGAFTLTANEWTHVAMVITSNTLTVYKNGNVAYTGAVGSPATPNGNFSLGSDNAGSQNFSGTIDEARVWTVARSQCDIVTYMNCEIATSAPGLQANYHFNQGIAAGSNAGVTSVTDASGNSNTIPLSNFALTGASSNWVAPGGVISGNTVSSAPTVSVSSAVSTLCSGSSSTLTGTGMTDLVAYYRLDEGTGSTTMDMSGNNLNGNLMNSPVWGASTATFTGAGNTLSFNTAYVDVADNPAFNALQNQLSIEAWIYQTDNADNAIVDRANYNFLFEACPNGQTGLGFYNLNGFWTYSAGTIPLNQWVHVAVTFDGANGTLKFYMNGALLSTHVRPIPLTFNAGPLNIARQEPNGCQCNIFSGMIDEMKIWSAVRTDEQILSSLTSTVMPMSFSWAPGSSLNATTGSSVIATPPSTTIYTATITDASNCTSTATTAISVNISPTISVNSGSICTGSSFTMVPGGATTYTIDGGSAVVSPTATISYTVTGISSAGCPGVNTATASVTVNSVPSVTVNSGVICAGNSFTITASGASTYTYSGGSSVISPTATTSYSVTGTSAQGCVSSNTAVSSVTVNALPTVSAVSNTTLLCTGQTASLSAGGANTYTWNTSSTASVIAVSPTVTTSYTVNGTGANGCSNAATVTQSVSACTGVDNLKSAEHPSLIVYPNPNSGEFTISSASEITLTIINNLGQAVDSVSLDASNNYGVSVTSLANGIYFVIGQSGTAAIRQKIIVAK